MPDKPAQPAPLDSITVGDMKITYLPDGDGRMAPHIVFPAGDQDFWAAHREYLDEDGRFLVSIGGFLVETGDRKVLVDTGFGDMTVPFPPVDGVFQGGRFLDSLKQTGVDPAEVDTVVYTHLHLDHVGWTARDGSLVFPNARHLAGEGEWDFWRGATDENLVAVGPHPEAVQPALENRLEGAADGEAVAPGITLIATPGHTPGHCSLIISSGAERAIVLGDVLHCPLQLDETQLEIIFDVDPAAARQSRERITRELEGEPQTIAADSHFSNAVFGRVVPGQGRRWVTVP